MSALLAPLPSNLIVRPHPEPTPAQAPRNAPHRITTDAESIIAAQHYAARIAPGAAQRDRERLLPWDALDDFVATGLWTITVPQAYGGPGLSAGTLAEVTALVSAADGSLGQIPQNHFYALEVLRVGGSDEQKRFFYSRVLAGERLGNALAEITHRDFQRRTRLVPDGNSGFHLHGE